MVVLRTVKPKETNFLPSKLTDCFLVTSSSEDVSSEETTATDADDASSKKRRKLSRRRYVRPGDEWLPIIEAYEEKKQKEFIRIESSHKDDESEAAASDSCISSDDDALEGEDPDYIESNYTSCLEMLLKYKGSLYESRTSPFNNWTKFALKQYHRRVIDLSIETMLDYPYKCPKWNNSFEEVLLFDEEKFKIWKCISPILEKKRQLSLRDPEAVSKKQAIQFLKPISALEWLEWGCLMETKKNLQNQKKVNISKTPADGNRVALSEITAPVVAKRRHDVLCRLTPVKDPFQHFENIAIRDLLEKGLMAISDQEEKLYLNQIYLECFQKRKRFNGFTNLNENPLQWISLMSSLKDPRLDILSLRNEESKPQSKFVEKIGGGRHDVTGISFWHYFKDLSSQSKEISSVQCTDGISKFQPLGEISSINNFITRDRYIKSFKLFDDSTLISNSTSILTGIECLSSSSVTPVPAVTTEIKRKATKMTWQSGSNYQSRNAKNNVENRTDVTDFIAEEICHIESEVEEAGNLILEKCIVEDEDLEPDDTKTDEENEIQFDFQSSEQCKSATERDTILKRKFYQPSVSKPPYRTPLSVIVEISSSNEISSGSNVNDEVPPLLISCQNGSEIMEGRAFSWRNFKKSTKSNSGRMSSGTEDLIEFSSPITRKNRHPSVAIIFSEEEQEIMISE